MRLVGQKLRRMTFKAVFTLFYFILLGSQLSHKFYFCANSPTRAFKYLHARSTAGEQFRSGGSALSNIKKYFPLSIDKRYEFKDRFAIPSPEISLQFLYLIPAPEIFFICPSAISSTYIIRRQRGPPSV